MVEVTFTVSPRVRRIAAHDPARFCPSTEYFRQIYFELGPGHARRFRALFEAITLEALDLPAGDKAILSLQLPPRS